MGIYEGNNEYMRVLVEEGARNIKSERARWKELHGEECPGRYASEPLRNYRNAFGRLFGVDDTTEYPFSLHDKSIDRAYHHAANMLANQVHAFLSIPGVNVNMSPQVTLGESIEAIIRSSE